MANDFLKVSKLVQRSPPVCDTVLSARDHHLLRLAALKTTPKCAMTVSAPRPVMANVVLAFISLCAIFGAGDTASEHLLISDKLGWLLGVQETSEAGTPYYAFRGIPYAAPPVGDLRFKVRIFNWF